MPDSPDIAGRHAVEVRAGAGECLAVLLDMERYPQWYDTLDAVEVLARDSRGHPERIRFVADAGPLGGVDLELRVSVAAERLAAEQIGAGRIESVRLEWVLTELEAGRVQVAYAFEASARGLAARTALRVARPLVERDLIRSPAEALKRRLETQPR